MLINGRVALKGSSNDPVLLEWGAASDPGQSLIAKQGVLKFTNGMKIQWDTIVIGANSSVAFTLPEAYTEAHWCSFAVMESTIGSTGNQEDAMSWVPVASILSKVVVRSIANGSRAVTYLSIGKDAV